MCALRCRDVGCGADDGGRVARAKVDVVPARCRHGARVCAAPSAYTRRDPGEFCRVDPLETAGRMVTGCSGIRWCVSRDRITGWRVGPVRRRSADLGQFDRVVGTGQSELVDHVRAGLGPGVRHRRTDTQ